MFQSTMFLFIYTETPLHAGTGRGLGAIDLPIQRERITNYPIIQAGSLKGRLRAEGRGRLLENEFVTIFGPETDRASDHAGALSPGDARLLLLPVRSLAGVFAWITSRQVLQRLLRDLTVAKAQNPDYETAYEKLHSALEKIIEQPPEPVSDEAERWALVGSQPQVIAGGDVVLEEFAFVPKSNDGIGQAVEEIGKWLANNALPDAPEYAYWKGALPRQLIILPEDDFRDFCLFGVEVATRVALNPDTKTVKEGPWNEEMLPAETLLYAPLHATPARTEAPDDLKEARQILAKIRSLNLTRTVLGGDETVGRGIVHLRFWDGQGESQSTGEVTNG
ncbi:MAG: type III-B CRISPR module RAMP protein Cmr4 [Syntrophobacteria bacterium]